MKNKPSNSFFLSTDAPLLTLEKKGKKSYFDYKDGKWQFWGDLSVDQSAKLLFEMLGKHIEKKLNKLKQLK